MIVEGVAQHHQFLAVLLQPLELPDLEQLQMVDRQIASGRLPSEITLRVDQLYELIREQCR